MSAVSTFLLLLLVAGTVLIWEARTGSLTPRTPWGGSARATLFFMAGVVGAALFYRTAPSSALLAAALVPVTVLSLFRLVMLLRRRWRGVSATMSLVVLLFTGTSVSLLLLPKPLDQRTFIEQIFHIETSQNGRSIDPASRRSVWV
jgi:hypothetical protein